MIKPKDMRLITTAPGTSGLGAGCAVTLAKHHPARLYISGRSAPRANAIIAQVQSIVPDADIRFLECDLGTLANVEAAAKHFLSENDRLDILMCSAGIMAQPAGLTHDGYEVQFGTNHIGHALLIKLLLPIMLHTADQPGSDVRIVSISSTAYKMSSGIPFKELKTSQDGGFGGPWKRYGQSKLANRLYAAALAKRYPSITSVSLHPGLVATELVTTQSWSNRLFLKLVNSRTLTPEEGTWNPLWAATTQKENLVNGEFYEPFGKLGGHSKASRSAVLQDELWDWTQMELESYKA